MSIIGSTSRHCYAFGCSSGDYQILRWKQKQCLVHGCLHDEDECSCSPPFEIYNFPTVKRDNEKRQRWIRSFSRADESHPHKLLEPKRSHRVCSLHFVDGRPSEDHPDPELKLGHDNKRSLSDSDKGRQDRYTKRQRQAPEIEFHLEDAPIPNLTLPAQTSSGPSIILALKFIIYILVFIVRRLKDENMLLKRQIVLYKSHVELLKKKQERSKPSFAKTILKNNKDTLFYTGIESLSLFHDLYAVVAPCVRRRWKGFKCLSTKARRKLVGSPKKFGPSRKLKGEDEFLLTLMWLRLGLLKKDLADRFCISESLCSQVFNSWLTAMSKIFSNFVFWPTKEEILSTKPKRYRHLPDLRSIIDCTEIFIETPKDPILQAATWSDYKHHNTAKFLVSVAPNSSITFCSSVYNGRASDKAITYSSGFLDLLEPYDMIQADKGFSIQDECVARRVQLHIPPGKRGQVQMSMTANVKTSRIANLRILVEQVIRRIKSFRILKYVVPISLVPSLDKMLKVTCGLCNLKKPIYKN